MNILPTDEELRAYHADAVRDLMRALFRFVYYHHDTDREQAMLRCALAAQVLGCDLGDYAEEFRAWALEQPERGSSEACREMAERMASGR